MKHLFILSMIFVSLQTFSQEKSEPESKPDRIKFKLGAIYSPDDCYRISKSTSSGYKSTKELRDNEDKPVFGYTTGLSAMAYLNKSIGMETGVYYTKKGEQGELLRYIYDPTTHYRSYVFDYTYNYNYLEIPLKFNYTISDKGISYFINAGIGLEIMLKPEAELVYKLQDFSRTDKYILDKDLYQQINLSTIVGLGIDYTITKKLAMSFEPTYTQLLTPVYFRDLTKIYPPTYDSDGVKEYPFSIGARVGIHYLFY